MPESFGSRLRAAVDERSPLVLGIDPHPGLLDAWNLPQSGEGARDFGLRVVEAARDRVALVKPQVAFFERFGAYGLAALEQVMHAARAAGLLVIADGKRGDIGSTMDGYGSAWLAEGAALEADALTIYAYQGLGADDGVIELARQGGKGVFVVTATSNPEALALQTATVTQGPYAGSSVAASLVREIDDRNQAEEAAGVGSIGVVLGATVAMADFGIEASMLAHTPILAPGFGFQGAQLGDTASLYGAAAANVLPSVSRSVLQAGPDGIAAALDAARAELGAES